MPLLLFWIVAGIALIAYLGTRPEQPSLPDRPSAAERARRDENRRIAERAAAEPTRHRTTSRADR